MKDREPMTDQEVTQMLDGIREAKREGHEECKYFDKFVIHFRPLVYEKTCKLNRNRIFAEEVANDVMMEVYHKIGTYTFKIINTYIQLKGLVFRIAGVRAIDEYHKENRPEKFGPKALQEGKMIPHKSLDTLVDRGTNPHATSEAEVASKVMSALHSLEDEQTKQYIIVKILGDYSLNEVADIFGASRSAIQRRIKAGLAQIKGMIERSLREERDEGGVQNKKTQS